MARERLKDIDMAKGLAIFLVVLGHVVARQPPADNEWYQQLKLLIYKFHMPFFMFLSGSVFYAAYPAFDRIAAYGRYVRKRAARLVPGFLLFSVVIWGGKSIGRHFLHVDNAPSEGWDAFVQIFVRPASSVAGSLWYVYVLFEFHVIFPILIELLRRCLPAILCVSVALHVVSLTLDPPSRFAIDQFCEYALFFSLGFAFVQHYETAIAFAANRSLQFYGLFALSFLAIQIWPNGLSKTLIGLCSLPAVFAFVTSIRSDRDRAVLLGLGEYTFTIYLMNTLFIGLTKGLILKILPWDDVNFVVFLPILLAAGLTGPIALHKFVLSRVPYLASITK